MLNISRKIFIALIAVNSINSKLKSEIFSFTDPTKAENIHINFSGVTESGKKWKAIGVNDATNPADELYKIFGNAEVMNTFGDHKTRSLDNAKARVQDWLTRFQKGLPTGGMLIYSADEQDNSDITKDSAGNLDENLIGFMVAGLSTVPSYSECAVAILPEYQGQGYFKSISQKFIEWGNEVRQIGLESSDKFTTDNENDVLLNSKISENFRAPFGKNGIQGLYITCSAIQKELSNTLAKALYPHYYTDKYFVALDSTGESDKHNSVEGTYEAVKGTYEDIIKYIDKALPSGSHYQSIIMPDKSLRTVTRNDADILKFAFDYPLSDEAKNKINKTKPFQTIKIQTVIKS